MQKKRTFIPSTKGLLASVITKPDKESKRLAVLCSGYLDTKDYLHLKDLAHRLAEIGYTTVVFDPTGTWKSQGEIKDYTTTQYLKDVESILKFMFSKTSYKHILLVGHSRGGMISLLYAAQDPRIDLVVAIMPSSGRIWTQQMREEWRKAGVRISERDLPENPSQKIIFKIPYSHMVDRDKYDLVKAVKKIKAKILFIAGEKDKIILPEDVKNLYDLAMSPKQFFYLT